MTSTLPFGEAIGDCDVDTMEKPPEAVGFTTRPLAPVCARTTVLRGGKCGSAPVTTVVVVVLKGRLGIPLSVPFKEEEVYSFVSSVVALVATCEAETTVLLLFSTFFLPCRSSSSSSSSSTSSMAIPPFFNVSFAAPV